VKAVWQARNASPLLLRLLDLLAERGRLDVLSAVAESYAVLHNAHKGVVRAEVVTAVPLETTQQRLLETALGQVADAKAVELRAQVDPTVLGGVLVRMAGRTYDGTVRGRLASLRARLAGSTAGGGVA